MAYATNIVSRTYFVLQLDSTNSTAGYRVHNTVRPEQASAVAPTVPLVNVRKLLWLILLCSLVKPSLSRY